jgi:hypothetical protein
MTQSAVPRVIGGNAETDAQGNGWFVGHFIDDPDDPRATGDVEVKWAVYAGGERRDGWGVNRVATTLAVLVRGRFRLRFPGRELVLERPGDFALWQPGVPHDWDADGPTIVVTVRWPSVADDSVVVPDPRASSEPPG